MATPASRTVPNSPNTSAQGSPPNRDWGNLRTGESRSSFRGISRGRGSRGGGVRGGRGGGHPPSNSGQRGGSHSDTANSTPSPSPTVLSVSRKPLVPSTATTPNGVSEKAANGPADRGGRPKPGSRKQSRAVPAVVVAPASPSETSKTAPPTPSRSANRRHRSQPGKSPTITTKPPPLPSAIKTQKPRGGSTPASQMVVRKDVPPHLVAAHQAEIRHDIDVLVERVRAVAMAENRPTTPGSHIDWAGDEDDSLPDLDDWGVTTTHTNATRDEDQNEEISPILTDTLKPLPEPNSEVHQEEEREMETYDTQPEQAEESSIQPSFLPSPTKGAAITQSTAEKGSEQCIVVPVEEPSSPTLLDGRFPLHHSLPPKPVAAMESLRVRGRSISKPFNLPPKPSVSVMEEDTLTTKTAGLSESIYAPSVDEYLTLERESSASPTERGLAASIHAPVSGLPESHSAPSLLSGHPSSAVPRTHSRSQTEGRPGKHQPHTAPPGMVSQRHGRSGASSPLGKHVYTHSRNHSTPAGGAGSRPPHASRPVITGEAISRLARTIGGLGPTPRTQAIPVTQDSTISS
ncbi:hypothetical protein J3R82DRAFT_4015 [Butyriboletus roseoflavus]|nr:hypothetical protein J3R82DRAFT_4015 [Butyriboletus roseoflavus]